MTEDPSQRFSATLSLPDSQESPHVLQPFALTLELIYPKEYRPDRDLLLDHLLRNPGPNELPPFDLLESTQKILISDDPTLIHEQILYFLEPQLPGHHPLSFLEITFLPTDPAKQPEASIASPLTFVDVLPAIPSDLDLKTLISPLSTLATTESIELSTDLRAEILKDHSSRNVQLFERKAIPWVPIGVLLLFLLINFLIKRMLNRKQSVPSISASSHQVTALNEAEQSLDQMKEEAISDPENVKKLMTDLIWSLRYYFEAEFQLKTSSQTTQEFLDTLQELPTLGQSQKESLLNFLQLADRIKFANYKPDFQECLEAYSTVQQIESNHS